MAALLHHRGPDSRGFFDADRCVLGNTRLQVLDLSPAGDLPMRSADGNVVLAYNGEVTNFRELIKQFNLDKKYAFKSTSDTEVVLHLYEELGIDFCRHLSGMYAFTLYDARTNKAWIVRDQYGIRPLFISRTADRLYFASEIKAFLDLPHFDGTLDREGLYHYFTLAYIPGRHTPFAQIEELQGGQLIEVDLTSGTVQERAYYEPTYAPNLDATEEELGEALYEQMRDSVRRNLIADAPLGFTLSGGFDTSSMLALGREIVGPDREIHTFSIAMDEPSFDESKYQRIMAEACNTIHHEVRVGPKDVMGALVEHMAYMDEPSGNGAAIPSYLLAKYATEHVTVLLNGEGGDETFTAYETHRAAKARMLYRGFTPAMVRRVISAVAHKLPTDYRKLSFDFVAKRFTEGCEMNVPASHLHWRHTLTETDKRALMPDWHDVPSTSDWATEWYAQIDAPRVLDRISVFDLQTYFIGDLMVKNDRTMMAHSIEGRFPYMDRQLFDFAATLPSNLRLKGFQGRYMQKLAMRGRMPKAISGRKNFGLEMPHSLWFLNEFRPLAEEYFSKAHVERCGFLDFGTVDRLWQEHVSKKRDHGRALWSILNLLVWFDVFVHDRSFKDYLR